MTRRAALGLALAATAATVVSLVPPPGTGPEAQRLAAVWAAVVVLWITEALPLPVTALLAPALAVLAGVAPAREAFGAFADPVIFLLIGSFLLALAFERSGLGRRLALFLLAHPAIAGRPMRILPAYGLVGFALSMWTSNTATAALLFPIGLSILHALEREHGPQPSSRYAACLLLLCSFGPSIGGLATPVGTPPNMIGLGLVERALGTRPDFLEWMAVFLPVSLLLLVAITALFVAVTRRDPLARPCAMPELRRERAELGPWTRREAAVAAIFGLTIVLWLLPSLWSLAAGEASASSRLLQRLLPESVAALIGAALLFVVTADSRPVLSWNEGRDIDWGTIMLFGGGISLGALLLSTGLGEAMGHALRGMFGVTTPLGVAALGITLAVFVSETSSNTASATLVVPVAIALAQHLQLDPTVPALAATAASSLGFMLPVSTAPNAIVFGSGRIRIGQMVVFGLAVDLIGMVLLAATALLLLR